MLQAEFILEELDSDLGYDSYIEVIPSDHCEDDISNNGVERRDNNGFVDKFQKMHCSEDSEEEDERRAIEPFSGRFIIIELRSSRVTFTFANESWAIDYPDIQILKREGHSQIEMTAPHYVLFSNSDG